MQAIFQDFSKELEKRFSFSIYTTEDSVRYTLFYCLAQSGYKPIDIVLEYPHPSIPNARVDTYIPMKEGRKGGIVFEFKFDRAIPSGKNTPRTQKAGKVFADLFRLALFNNNSPLSKYFIYVTDEEMATYFTNPSNKLDPFFQLLPEKTLQINHSFFDNYSSTFKNSIGIHIADFSLKCVFKKDYSSNYWLRIYQVD